ncbi:MAG: FAD-dependent oxidoreductase [Armatimonadota bacterium]|nr:FAD-dependent oxidoreductase [Armatimonadota bacterium]
MSERKHVVVVGAGIIGSCCAYSLTRRGHHVTIIDRGAPESENCSFGNAGLIVPSHIVPLAAPGMVMLGLKWMRDPESPFYVKPRLAPDLLDWAWKFHRAGTRAHVERCAPLLRDLSMASRACYEALNAELGDTFAFEQRGLLLLCKTRRALDEEAHVVEHARRLGMPGEILDSRQVAEREPNLRMDICGAAFYPNDCHLAPAALMAALRRQLAHSGVQLQWNTEAKGWRRNAANGGQRVMAVVTNSGEVAADEFVLCGGSWSPQMARQLGVKLPMQAGKGYSLTLSKPRRKPMIPAILTEARVAVTPMGESLRFAGTMEIAGLDTGINPARVRGILKSVPSYYPDFSEADFAGVAAWVGLRPCSPDGLPFVGRTRRFDNLCIATGHAMMGLSLGPVTGEIIAQIVSGETPGHASALLDPDRYA